MNLLIKFSGEFFDTKDDLLPEGKEFAHYLAKHDQGYIVIGGGNRIRGRSSHFCRNASDNIGVISTLMNGFILKENLIHLHKKVHLFSHFIGFGTFYSPKDAIEVYERGNWVILASGLGKVGYISTDLSAVIKALELKVDGVVKITKSGGVFDKDPKHSDAKLIKRISYDEILEKKLAVMDFAAIAIAQENSLPVAIMKIQDFPKFMNKEDVGSLIGKDWR